MKKYLIILLFIVLSVSYSFADNYKKITVEEIENIFFSEEEFLTESNTSRNSKYHLKRIQFRNLPSCTEPEECWAKTIRKALTTSEKYKKRYPGRVFYAFVAMENFINEEKSDFAECGYGTNKCLLKKRYLKKFEKFKKNPSNEKVLGRKLISYIKKVRTLKDIRAKTVVNESFYLLGDYLNASVRDVADGRGTKDVNKRRELLKKYSSILLIINNKIEDDNYKSLNKDVSNLSKTYKKLNVLDENNCDAIKEFKEFLKCRDIDPRFYKKVINFDKAVDIIFDADRLTQINILNSQNNENNKLLALASINYMQSLIDSILDIIPDKYHITKGWVDDLFDESDNENLQVIMKNMYENKITKCKKLTQDINKIKKSFNPFDIEKKLNDLNIINSKCKLFKQDDMTKIADIKSIDKKWINEILRNTDFIKEISNEASNVVSEVYSSSEMSTASSNKSGSGSILDRKFGEVTVRQLIGASRR